MSVTLLIASAFQMAAAVSPDVNRRWISLSFKVGTLLPNSELPASIQRIGQLDSLVRCLESEFQPNDSPESEGILAGHNLVALSELWVGSIYEVFRLLIERKLVAADGELGAVAHDLRLLRIPLEKHEIAVDRKLNVPLQLERWPLKGDASDYTEYSNKDPLRSHIVPRGFSETGSAMWHVIDIGSGSSFWLERRAISDRAMIALENLQRLEQTPEALA